VLEIVLTFLLVFVVLMATEKAAALGSRVWRSSLADRDPPGGIPLDGTSVNRHEHWTALSRAGSAQPVGVVVAPLVAAGLRRCESLPARSQSPPAGVEAEA